MKTFDNYNFGKRLGQNLLDNKAILVSMVYQNPEDHNDLDYAMRLALTEAANTENTVILWSNRTIEELGTKAGFAKFLAMPNTGFINGMPEADAVVALVEKIRAGGKIANPAVVASGTLEETEQRIRIHRHMLMGYQKGTHGSMDDFLRIAAELGFEGTEEEVIAAMQSWKRQTSGFLAGQYFPGLFVDVQGTLLQEDGILNPDVVALAEEAAQSKPVTVWTDGDLKELVPMLRNLGITYNVVSKFDFHGAEVEEAIDDKSQDEFETLYGIRARLFRQV